MTRLGQMLVEDGIEQGIQQGIEQGIKQGIEQCIKQENEDLRSLFRLLLENNRIEDMKKATEDAAYCLKLKEEFSI